MQECRICQRLTPGFNGLCSRCLHRLKQGTYAERNDTRCFLVDFLGEKEAEIEMAFVRWQAERLGKEPG